jgi:uncharacterized protein
MNSLAEKRALLESRLRELGSVLIAYSGGVDSAYLAWAARQVSGLNMVAILADSPSLARAHFDDAIRFAKEQAIPLEIIRTAEMENAEYVKNDMQRCFHCKSELFAEMEETRVRLGFRHLAYGMNLDDRGDFRPGQQAARDRGVLAPLVDAGLTKADIRALAQEAGLQVWDKPASACLSSRIAYGNPVTREALSRIEQAEAYLREHSFRQFRVRDHAGLARVEIAPEELDTALTPAFVQEMATAFRALGFTYVTLDCDGYRAGSLNAEISHAARVP